MEPKATDKNYNVLSIRDHNFFKKEKCPMRSGGARCSCVCAVARVDSKDKLRLDDVANWRQDVLEDFERIKAMRPRPMVTSSVWADLELKVRTVMSWVLCNKHQAQLDMAVSTTMNSLKAACGPPVPDNSTKFDNREGASNNQTAPPVSYTRSFAAYAHDETLQNMTPTPAHSSNVPNDSGQHNHNHSASRSSHFNAHPALSDMNACSSHYTRAHAAAHLATPSPSPVPYAQRPMLQPITINNNNTTYMYPATPQQAATAQPLSTAARRATEARSISQPQVKPEEDCELTKSQAPINPTDREFATEGHSIRQRTRPQSSHVFSVRPRTESDASVSQQAQPNSLKSGSPSPLPYAETDCISSRQEFLEMKKKCRALKLRDKCRQKEFDELKVRFHTTDDRLFESESKNSKLEAQLREAMLRIGELQLENAGLKAQEWEEESEGESQSDEDLDGIL